MATIAPATHIRESTRPASVTSNTFPGPLVTGVAMISGPLLGILGLALSIGVYKFKGADMMRAMASSHLRAGFGINVSVASMVVLVVAVIGLSQLITAERPGWGRWGGVLTVVGLMGPVFFEGIFWGSYQLTGATYQAAGAHLIDHANRIPGNIMNVSVVCIISGWIVLGIGAYKARLMPKLRAVCLGLGCFLAPALAAAIVPLGIAVAVLLAIALAPLGWQLIARAKPRDALETAATTIPAPLP